MSVSWEDTTNNTILPSPSCTELSQKRHTWVTVGKSRERHEPFTGRNTVYHPSSQVVGHPFYVYVSKWKVVGNVDPRPGMSRHISRTRDYLSVTVVFDSLILLESDRHPYQICPDSGTLPSLTHRPPSFTTGPDHDNRRVRHRDPRTLTTSAQEWAGQDPVQTQNKG